MTSSATSARPPGPAKTQPVHPARRPGGETYSMGCLLLLFLPLLIIPGLFLTSGAQLSLYAARRLADSTARDDLATQMLSVAVLLWPGSASLHDALGQAHFAAGELRPALERFERASELDPELAAARNDLGVALLAAGQPAPAIPHLQAAVELDPQSSLTLYNLGRAQEETGELEAARRSYQRAAALEPEVAEYWLVLASLTQGLGDLDGARLAYERALQVDRANPFGLHGLGSLLAGQSRPAEALPYLQAAARLAPDDPHLLYEIGVVFEELGQAAQAEAAYQRLLELEADPGLIELVQSRLQALQSAPDAGLTRQGGEKYPTP